MQNKNSLYKNLLSQNESLHVLCLLILLVDKTVTNKNVVCFLSTG